MCALRFAKPSQFSTGSQSKATAPWKKHRVLIVDDEQAVREQLRTELRLKGFNVSVAPSGEEALGMLDHEPAQLVISDQKMDPGMSGTAFLCEVKAKFPDTVTMVLSGFAETEYLLGAMNEAGAFQYLLKPWEPEQLLTSVSQGLQFYHERAERRRLAKANEDLLKRLAVTESFFMMGDFSTALFERFFPTLRNLYQRSSKEAAGLREGSEEHLRMLMEREKWSELSVVLSKLRLLARFYNESRKFEHREPAELIQSCLNKATATAKELDLEIDFAFEGVSTLPKAWLQPETFRCGIVSLIENAALASARSPQEGTPSVLVTVSHQHAPSGQAKTAGSDSPGPGYLRIDVRDTGAGVSEVLAGKIFKPLFSTASVPSPEPVDLRSLSDYNLSPYNHIGLGLSIAKWCATQHEAHLSLVNPGERGALFRLDLPLKRPESMEDLRSHL